jgi:formamidopyrimidine-DNA glycosylase
MPEAPEIYYLKELLKTHILNHNIKNIVSNTDSVVKLPQESKVIDCDCKGKLLWIETEDYYIHLHMMISGWLVFEPPKICKYEFHFDNIKLYMDDTRRFSKVSIIKSDEKHEKIISELGETFLNKNLTEDIFTNIVSKSNKSITALLLDQKIFSGVGNYIRNEALYLAKIHPEIKSKNLSIDDIHTLYHEIRFVMFSNLYEMMENDDLKIPKKISNLAPDELEVPYIYKVYDREVDKKGNNVTREKTNGRWSYYVKKIQKL